jgi:hypothetical protein
MPRQARFDAPGPYTMLLSENQIGEGVMPPLLCFTTKNTEKEWKEFS